MDNWLRAEIEDVTGVPYKDMEKLKQPKVPDWVPENFGPDGEFA